MEQKINNTFLKAHEQIDSLQNAFRPGGKLEKAIIESGGDTSVISAVNRALTEASNSIVSAVTPQVLSEGVLDDQDDDGFMARSQLYFLAKNAIALHGMIDDRDDLEPWVHTKIVAASEGIDAVRRYTEYNAMKNQSQPEMEPQLPMAIQPQPAADPDMNEGTWSIPSDMTAVGELIELFQDPISAKDAADKMYSLIGDDSLFDDFYELENDYGPDADARPTIARWIENNNALLANNIEDFDAIKSLNKLAAQFVESVSEGKYKSHAQRKAVHAAKAENESYSPGDENEEGMVSNCCGAPIMDVYQGHGRCSDCKEMASAESVNEAEKRWKQTSLSPAEAEKMYGAANVRVKKGALRNGDDMVEILSEAELDEGTNFDDKKDSELKVVAKDMFKSALAQARKKSGVK